MMILQKVRGNAVGQPDGQDDQDRPYPALQVELCEQKIFVQQMKEKWKWSRTLCNTLHIKKRKLHKSKTIPLHLSRVGEDGRPEAVDHVLQLQEAMQAGHQARWLF